MNIDAAETTAGPAETTYAWAFGYLAAEIRDTLDQEHSVRQVLDQLETALRRR